MGNKPLAQGRVIQIPDKVVRDLAQAAEIPVEQASVVLRGAIDHLEAPLRPTLPAHPALDERADQPPLF